MTSSMTTVRSAAAEEELAVISSRDAIPDARMISELWSSDCLLLAVLTHVLIEQPRRQGSSIGSNPMFVAATVGGTRPEIGSESSTCEAHDSLRHLP